MKKYDFHIHTSYCDGKNTPRQMLLRAIEEGFSAVGFSAHSYTSIDKTWCMSMDNAKKYQQEITSLKEEFSDKINIFCGVEQDMFADEPWIGKYDYAIGSVHYVHANGKYLSVDESEEEFMNTVKEHYNGDALSFAEAYYDAVGNVIEVTKADVIGHFDLIAKFNRGDKLFNSLDERYIAAWKRAADKLLAHKKPFEVNVGAMSRGYTCEPYPSLSILKYISENGGEVIFSGDCHSIDALGAYMKEADDVVKRAGFKSLFCKLPDFINKRVF